MQRRTIDGLSGWPALALAVSLPGLLLSRPASAGATGAAFSPRQLRAVYVAEPPVIDGELGDAAWRPIPTSSRMVQGRPNPGEPAAFDTEVRVGYDDEALYIAARCLDPEPAAIVARVTRRDRWLESDWFQIEIDSRLDRRTGFLFAVNPAGVQVDGTLYDDTTESTDWDGVWEAGVQVVADAWQVELRIPLKLLRYSPGEDVRFGVNFRRRISRLNQDTQWQYVPPDLNQRVSRFGLLTGLDLRRRPIAIEATPYAAARMGAVDGALEMPHARSADLGVDAKVGLGGDLALTAAVNPDFGQVEADEVVLNLSTFETYLQEKRPFFLEDTDLFRRPSFGDLAPVELLYTRRIGRVVRSPELADDEALARPLPAQRILGAAKVVGRVDSGTSVGLLQVVTGEEYVPIRSSISRGRLWRAEPTASASVLRLKQDFLSSSAAGLMATAAAAEGEGAAFTGGTDLSLDMVGGDYNLTLVTHLSALTEERWARQDDFTLAGLEREGAFGYGGDLVVWRKNGKHLIGGVGGLYRSPSLALNDLGFSQRPDLVSGFGWLQLRRFEPVGPFERMWLNFNGYTRRNTQGLNIGDGGNLNGGAVFEGGWQVGSWIGGNPPGGCDDRETRTGGEVAYCSHKSFLGATLWGESDPRQVVVVSGDASIGNTARGVAGGAGVSVEWKPLPQLQLEAGPRYNRREASMRWIDTIEDDHGDRFLFALQHSETWSLTLRSTYTFTPALSLQAYLQGFLATVDHRDQLAGRSVGGRVEERDLVPITDSEDAYDYSSADVVASVVLRWEYLPGSVAYLVYSGTTGREQEVADFGAGRLTDAVERGESDHRVMLKLSYLVD